MSEAINNMSEANNAGIYLPGAPPPPRNPPDDHFAQA